MEHLTIPQGYVSPLTIRETEVAIKEIKDYFERSLAKSLHLTRVSAPLFVKPESGLNDNLNGVERPVSFGIKEQDDTPAEIVHSLAKWKRYALKHYGFHSGEGLYTGYWHTWQAVYKWGEESSHQNKPARQLLQNEDDVQEQSYQRYAGHYCAYRRYRSISGFRKH